MEFGVATHAIDDRFVITLTGELDIESVASLDAAIAAAERSDCHRVEVDMEQVQFIDSSGMRGLIRAYKRFDSDGKALRITAMSGPVSRLLALTGQLERFTAG